MNDIFFLPIHRPWRAWLAVAAAAWLPLAPIAAAGPAEVALPAVLDLPADGFLTGALVATPAADAGGRETFLWRSPMFAEPCEFALDSIRGIRFPLPVEAPPPAAGDWRIELVDGDELVGGIESIDERNVVATIGGRDAPVRMTVRRESVARIVRSGEGFFLGPAGLSGWTASPSGGWREEGGRLIGGAGASLFRRLEAGPRSRYDIVLSWKKPPTMQVAVGIGDARGESAYRLELGSFGMAAVRQEPKASSVESGWADLEPLGDLPAQGIAMSVFVDGQVGRMAVIIPGQPATVADFTVPPQGHQAGAGFRLAVAAGDVALELLRVGPWRGKEPTLEADPAGSIRLQNGTTIPGEVTAWERDSLVLGSGAGTSAASKRIPFEQIAEILFPASREPQDDVKPAQPRSVRLYDHWGSRLTGGIDHVEAGGLVLVHPAVAEPLSLPLDGLATLTSLLHRAEPRKIPGRIGRIEGEAGRCMGCLVNGPPSADAGGATIAWQPQGSVTASPLAADPATGSPRATITYVVRPPQKAGSDVALGGIRANVRMMNDAPTMVGWTGPLNKKDGIQLPAKILEIAPNGDTHFVKTEGLSLEDVQNLLRGKVGSSLTLRLKSAQKTDPQEVSVTRRPLGLNNPALFEQALATHARLVSTTPTKLEEAANAPFAATLVLRTGETLPCRVESIDESGVRVQMPESDPVTVPHDLVQAVELVPAPTQKLSREKFRSLTILPRSQEQEPPTHLARSRNGDYLRGRLESLDDKTLRMSVEARPQGKTVEIPRAEVARLIWLHPENLAKAWRPPQPLAAAGLPVEGVIRDGERLRLLATAIDGIFLVGTNPVIGPCRIDIAAVQMLRIGTAATAAPSSGPFTQWRLEPAPDPRNLPPRRSASGADAGAASPDAALRLEPVAVE